MSREYFKLNDVKINDVLKISELELIIPEGFNKTLNSMELRQLLDDQLLEKGLELDNLVMDGASRVVSASKKARPIECNPQRSKRIREYLSFFNNEEVIK